MQKVYFTQLPTFFEDFETWTALFQEIFVKKN
jgi:hypothetical protein